VPEKPKWRSFSEYLLAAAVRRADVRDGAGVDERLEELPITGMTAETRDKMIAECDAAIEAAEKNKRLLDSRGVWGSRLSQEQIDDIMVVEGSLGSITKDLDKLIEME